MVCCKKDNMKPGCKGCRKVGILGTEKPKGLGISKEWTSCSVKEYGDWKRKQKTHWEKYEYKDSCAHNGEMDITVDSAKGKLKECALKRTLIINKYLLICIEKQAKLLKRKSL